MRKQGKYETRRVISPPKPRRKKDKNKLLLSFFASIMGMVLCTSMLMGTTMAWFTDTVEVTGNQIKTGKLAVDIALKSGGNWVSLKENKETKVFNGGVQWQPNHIEVRQLKITNTDSLPLRYVLNLWIDAGEVNVAQYFHVFVADITGDAPEDTYFSNLTWGELNNKSGEDIWDYKGRLSEISTNGTFLAESRKDGDGNVRPLTTNESVTYAVALWMEDTAVQAIAADKILSLTLKLDAYQYNIPEEAIGESFTVEDAAALTLALNRGGTIQLTDTVDGNEKILPWSGQFTGEYIWKTGGTLTGGTLKLDEQTQYAFVAEAGSGSTRSFNISNISFSGTGNQSTLYVGANGGKVNISNVTVTASGGTGIYVEDSVGEGVELSGCTVYQSGLEDGYDAKFNTAVAVESSQVVINSGTYSSTGSAVRTFDSRAEVTINGGSFTGGLKADAGTIIINGGTFTIDPSGIAGVTVNGTVTDNGDNTWTVTPSISKEPTDEPGE